MPTIALTRRELRQEIIRMLPPDSWAIEQPSSGTGSPITALVFGGGMLPGATADNHFGGGELRLVDSDGQVKTRRITTWNGTTATATLNLALTATTVGSLSNCEILASPWRFQAIDGAIVNAYREHATSFPLDESIESLLYFEGQREYLLPDTVLDVRGLQQQMHPDIDRYTSRSGKTLTDLGLGDTAAHTKLAVRVRTMQDAIAACAAVLLRKVGSPAGVTTASLHAASGGSPTGAALVSGVLQESGIGGSYGWYRLPFTFARTMTSNTDYFLVFTTSRAVDPVNYVAFRYDSAGVPGSGHPQSWNGSVWTSLAGGICFTLQDERKTWGEVARDVAWTVPNASNRSIMLVSNDLPTDGTQFRVLTGALPGSMDTDGASVDAGRIVIRYTAIAQLYETMAIGDRSWLQQAAIYRDLAKQARRRTKPTATPDRTERN